MKLDIGSDIRPRWTRWVWLAVGIPVMVPPVIALAVVLLAFLILYGLLALPLLALVALVRWVLGKPLRDEEPRKED